MTDRYLFRGFHPCENGKESVWIEGKEIKGKWVYGSLVVFDENYIFIMPKFDLASSMTCTQIFGLTSVLVIPETVGQYTGIEIKGQEVFVDDILQYNTYDDFDCQAVVKFGKYWQDGSSGEYKPAKCLGIYCDVDNFTCPDWCESPECFGDYRNTISLLEIGENCKVIGSIHSNPDILERKEKM